MATAEPKTVTEIVTKEVEVQKVVITVSPEEAAFIAAAVGAVRIGCGDKIGVDVYDVFSVLNNAVGASGARRLTATSLTEIKVDTYGWPGR